MRISDWSSDVCSSDLTVTVRRTGTEHDVNPDDLAAGDIMIVKPGERIATDGTVRAGRSALDLSAITGESVPVETEPGHAVLAASINGSGVLEIEVTAPTADSPTARLVHLVQDSQARQGAPQPPPQRLAPHPPP